MRVSAYKLCCFDVFSLSVTVMTKLVSLERGEVDGGGRNIKRD